jgi:hypothetical protein
MTVGSVITLRHALNAQKKSSGNVSNVTMDVRILIRRLRNGAGNPI